MKALIMLALLIIPAFPPFPYELTPIQQCVIQWQEYEILIRYMVDHRIIDIRFLILDEFMASEAVKIWEDYQNAESVSVNLERGLLAFKTILDDWEINNQKVEREK